MFEERLCDPIHIDQDRRVGGMSIPLTCGHVLGQRKIVN
jgi:hypothetical protein